MRHLGKGRSIQTHRADTYERMGLCDGDYRDMTLQRHINPFVEVLPEATNCSVTAGLGLAFSSLTVARYHRVLDERLATFSTHLP